MPDDRDARDRLAEVLAGAAVDAAPALLGAVLRHGPVAVRLVEVEAYDQSDEASHSFHGPTGRTAVMFGPPGRLYVYFSYGVHWAANVICGPEGHGAGVLLRAGEVVDGLAEARTRRGERITDRDLARGPGRLSQALGLDRRHYGADLVDGSSLDGELLQLHLGPDAPPDVASGPRVGISRATDVPWRFWIPDDPFVSAFRPGKRAR